MFTKCDQPLQLNIYSAELTEKEKALLKKCRLNPDYCPDQAQISKVCAKLAIASAMTGLKSTHDLKTSKLTVYMDNADIAIRRDNSYGEYRDVWIEILDAQFFKLVELKALQQECRRLFNEIRSSL